MGRPDFSMINLPAGPALNNLRLSRATGNPTPAPGNTTRVYATPYRGQALSLYDGTRWRLMSTGEISIPTRDNQNCDTTLASDTLTVVDSSQMIVGMVLSGNANIPALTTILNILTPTTVQMSAVATGTAAGVATQFDVAIGTNLDIFAVPVNTFVSVGLRMVAWATNVARATALVRFNGVWTLTGAPTWRYLGTVRIGATAGTVEDTVTQRFLWNVDNRLPRELLYQPGGAANWNYALAAWQARNADATSILEWLQGLDEDPVALELQSYALDSLAAGGFAAVAIDVDPVALAPDGASFAANPDNVIGCALRAKYNGRPGIGYHSALWIESATPSALANMAFYGTPAALPGLTGRMWGTLLA